MKLREEALDSWCRYFLIEIDTMLMVSYIFSSLPRPFLMCTNQMAVVMPEKD